MIQRRGSFLDAPAREGRRRGFRRYIVARHFDPAPPLRDVLEYSKYCTLFRNASSNDHPSATGSDGSRQTRQKTSISLTFLKIIILFPSIPLKFSFTLPSSEISPTLPLEPLPNRCNHLHLRPSADMQPAFHLLILPHSSRTRTTSGELSSLDMSYPHPCSSGRGGSAGRMSTREIHEDSRRDELEGMWEGFPG